VVDRLATLKADFFITAEQEEADLLAEAEAIFNNPDAFLVQEEALLAA
tara:strand:+ start:114 stop:257 length:144 start_codon:yes stop_codon:yes gene_type:complete